MALRKKYKRPQWWGLTFLALLVLSALTLGCSNSGLLSGVSISKELISPNGDGVDDFTTINYTLVQNVNVSISLLDAGGKQHFFRKDEKRAAGDYTATFYGTYTPDSNSAESLVLPDGEYTVVVGSKDDRDTSEEWRGKLTIKGGDTSPPRIIDIVCNPCSISPNGDGADDETAISYNLTKPAVVTVFATDPKGETYPLEPTQEKRAALHSHRWNGTSGGRLLPDGDYTVHIRAQDKAGNVVEGRQVMTVKGGGTPRLEITEVRFDPPTVPAGGLLKVEIKVKNVGDTVLRSLGPDPGASYTTQMNFNSFKENNDPNAPPLFFEQPGYWRVGVSWSTADRAYPIRWGLGKDLAPGEEATTGGTIKVMIDQTREVFFWASVVQEGVGFPGGQVGQKKIIVSY